MTGAMWLWLILALLATATGLFILLYVPRSVDPVFKELVDLIRKRIKEYLEECNLFTPEAEHIFNEHFAKFLRNERKLPWKVNGHKLTRRQRGCFALGMSQAFFWQKLAEAKILKYGLEVGDETWVELIEIAICDEDLPRVLPNELIRRTYDSAITPFTKACAEGGEDAEVIQDLIREFMPPETGFFIFPWFFPNQLPR